VRCKWHNRYFTTKSRMSSPNNVPPPFCHCFCGSGHYYLILLFLSFRILTSLSFTFSSTLDKFSIVLVFRSHSVQVCIPLDCFASTLSLSLSLSHAFTGAMIYDFYTPTTVVTKILYNLCFFHISEMYSPILFWNWIFLIGNFF
jgi:hypothetical protein